MSRNRFNPMFSLILFGLVAALAWPVFVVVSSALSFWAGEGSLRDTWQWVPEHLLLRDFLTGYRDSLVVAVPLGLLAVLDFQLLSRHRLTWILAGLSLPATCVGLAFWFYKDPLPVLPLIAATGVILLLIYRTAEWLRRVY